MKKVFLTLTVILLSISFYPVSAMEKTADILKKNVVTSGDGLYVDSTVDGRYIYRGGNPNNYIRLGDDLYRIISVEKDGTIKVIKQESIGEMAWDKENIRKSTDSNDFCTGTLGCKSWGSKTTTLDSSGNNVTQMPRKSNGTLKNLPEKEASLNTYLNNDFYNGLSDDVKKMIINGTWSIGTVDWFQSNLLESIKEESAYKWKGKVALINATDYVKASTNSACTSMQTYTSEYEFGSRLCYENSSSHNYLYSNNYPWTVSSEGRYEDNSFSVYCIYSDGFIGGNYANFAKPNYSSVRPVFFLSSEIILTGEGTETNPYTVSKNVEEVKDNPKDEENKGDVKVDNGQVVEVPSTSAFGSIIIAVLGIVCVTGSALVMKRTTGRGK